MFVKVTTSGPRRYVQLVESYRNEAGRVKKCTVTTLGRLDQLSGEIDSVIDGLLKVSGRAPTGATKTAAPAAIAASCLSFESARALGNVWTLTELWKELGFSDLRRVFRRTRHTIDVETLIRIMVLSRLCDPDSKLGVLRWLQTVALPDKVMERFPDLRRLILVADRGLLSLDNLEALQAIRLNPDKSEDKSQGPSKRQALEFIIAVPGRRYNEFADLLGEFQHKCAQASTEITGEVAWNDLRLVVAHDPATALEQQQKRRAQMAELQAQANGWAGKLDEQDQSQKEGTQALGQWRQGAFLPRRVRGSFGKNHQG